MKRIEFELPEFHSFSGCDELIEFLLNVEIRDLHKFDGLDAEFQGDNILINRMGFFGLHKAKEIPFVDEKYNAAFYIWDWNHGNEFSYMLRELMEVL